MSDSTKRAFSPWPYAIVAFFIVIAVYQFFFLRLATQSFNGYIDDEAFSKGFAYQSELDAREAIAKNGWRVHYTTATDSPVSLTLQDSSGAPILGAFVRIEAVRPSDKTLDREYLLAFQDGVYKNEEALPAPGLWHFRAEILHNETRALIKEQRFVK